MNILLTGGSRGIGKSIKDLFEFHGHDVYSPTREELDLSKPISLPKCKFDIIINNAGVNFLKSILDINNDEIMRINYTSPLEIIQQCLPYMVSKQYGRIINIGSIWIDLSKPQRSALHSLTKSLTVEYAFKGILSNTISPGFIATDLTYQNNSEEQLNALKCDIPVGRLGLPEEIAKLTYYLTVDNTYITGQNIKIDGGYTCTVY